MNTFLVSISCSDRTGLIAQIAGRLFDLGVNLGDTAFAALAGDAEFSTVCDVPQTVPVTKLEAELSGLPLLVGATVKVVPFRPHDPQAPSNRVTHRIVVSGGDRPGLIARLSEALVQYGANIVRLDAHRFPEHGGHRYVTRIDAAIPKRSADACLATIGNTAGELALDCHWEAVEDGG